MRRILALPLVLAGCFLRQDGSSCAEQACTALFAMVTVTVVDAADRPVDGLVPTTTHAATGARVELVSPTLGGGVYVVVDDNILGSSLLLDRDEHVFRFEATSATGVARADFVVGAGECDCHVTKLDGPDRVALQ